MYDDIESDAIGQEPVDQEGAMARADLYKLANYSFKLFKKIKPDDQLESWVQAKIVKSADYIASVYHYLEYEMELSEYGKKIDNSEIYNEDQKRNLKNKLVEAKAALANLKKKQADKLEKNLDKSKKTDNKKTTNSKVVEPKVVESKVADKKTPVKKADEKPAKKDADKKPAVKDTKDKDKKSGIAAWNKAKKTVKENFEKFSNEPEGNQFEPDSSKSIDFTMTATVDDVEYGVDYESDTGYDPEESGVTLTRVIDLDTGRDLNPEDKSNSVIRQLQDQAESHYNDADYDSDPTGQDKPLNFTGRNSDTDIFESNDLSAMLKLSGQKPLLG